jgi:hypothetical protein
MAADRWPYGGKPGFPGQADFERRLAWPPPVNERAADRKSEREAEPKAEQALRIGDRERDEVTRVLHDAFAQGRITRDELDERLEATLTARTTADLRPVTADLPDTDGWPAYGDELPHPHHHPHRPHHSHHLRHMARHAEAARRRAEWQAYRRGRPEWQAEWRAGRRREWRARRRAGRPHVGMLIPAALIGFVVASGAAWPLLAAVKMLLMFWAVTAVFGLIRHRRWHNSNKIGT